MGTGLIIVGGFLIGGAYSVWQQGASKSRQAKGFAAVLVVLALMALAGGVLRLVAG
jgi:hypothetical protein